MRLILLLISLAVCSLPWRAAFAQELSGQDLVDVLVARTPGATLDRMRERRTLLCRRRRRSSSGMAGQVD